MSETGPGEPRALPQTRGGVVAYLTVDGAMRASDFYRRAFGAELAGAIPVDDKGRTMHVHLYINGSSLMLSDAFPEHGHPLQPPQSFSLMLPVDDIAAWWDRAVAAGATVVMPYQEMFWGDVYGQLRDPFGITWAMNQSKRPICGLSGGCPSDRSRGRWSCEASTIPERPDEHPSECAFDAVGSRATGAAGPERAQPDGGGRDDGRVPQDGAQVGRPL